ncbi:alanine racemase [Anaerosporobacter mobilis DSM 15930]|uniref:Alanine racemase n=2 Tax=Anaerosporobacter TaxID=653683 RepID=A0A1M7N0F2_9FIRM|nr:alanine racemase [Anaerosporobacter mobilis]SHM96967.1 alanine racemase [Anaerosporobacter mobilis DSM 15930]
MNEYYRVEARINLDAICNNIDEVRRNINDNTKIMAVIKADGYGHGAVALATALKDKVDAYGIAIIEEGIELRLAGFEKPILILGFTPHQQYEDLLKYDISQTVFQYDMAKRLSDIAVSLGKQAKIHIKIDTGMTRIGFKDTDESIQIIKEISKLPNLIIEGLFTHFACADESDKTSVRKQLSRFLVFADKLEKEGIHIPVKHVSNSASIIDLPEANLDMVRSGIVTYGMYPSDEVNKNSLMLQPALTLKSNVVYVKEVEAGTGISYNSTYITEHDSVIATIPVGYADGYPRQLSSKGRVLIHGKSVPIVGRVCMDQFMVDVTNIPDVKEGDMVTLIGQDGDESISIEEVANLVGSFNYELVCDIGKRVPRVYYKEGKKVGTADYYNCLHQVLELLI